MGLFAKVHPPLREIDLAVLFPHVVIATFEKRLMSPRLTPNSLLVRTQVMLTEEGGWQVVSFGDEA